MAAPETAQSGFSPEDAAAALSGEEYHTRDLAHGDGIGLAVNGEQGPRQLELFDGGKAARLSGPSFRLEVVGSFTPHVADGRVWLTDTTESHVTTVGLRADGSVIFQQVPHVTEGPQRPDTPQSGTITHPEPPAPAEDATPDPSVGDETSPDAEHQEDHDEQPHPASGEDRERGTVVSFTGRLGRDPHVSERDGKVRVKLTVGEHYVDEDTQEEKTRWHEVWAASTNAETVRDQAANKELRRGTEVRVRGYQHTREPRNGKPQPPFVRAFQIAPTRKPRPDRS